MSLKDRINNSDTYGQSYILARYIKPSIINDINDFKALRCAISVLLKDNKNLYEQVDNLLDIHLKLKKIRFGDFEK